MNFSTKTLTKLLSLAAGSVLALGATTVVAGEIDLAWDVPSHDIAGYRVYYDTEPGGNYRSYVDTGATPSLTLTSLSNCTRHYIAVKAKDSGGLMSPGFSNEISGFPRPQIVSMTPSSLERGQTAEVVVTGMNFAPGATAELTNVTVNSSTVDSCGQLRLQVTVGPNASGASALTVVNTDGGYGTQTGALIIAGTPSSFSVSSVSPAAGAAAVDADPVIRITFTQAIDPRTVTASRFRLIRRSSGPSPRFEAGSPSLDATGKIVTIRIAGTLIAEERYVVDVKGGRKGVLDTTGIPLSQNFTQSTPFTVAPLFEGTYHGPSAAATEFQPLAGGATIPAVSVLVVKFTEPMSALSVSPKTIQVKSGRLKVNVAVTLSADGRSAILTPATALPHGASCTLTIKGGLKGVQSARGVTLLALQETVSFTIAEEALEGLGVAD